LLTPAVYPALQTALLEQEVLLKRVQGEQGDSDGEEVQITIRDVDRDKEVLFIPDSSPPPPNWIDSSNVESDAGSIDSIQRNVDFVGFVERYDVGKLVEFLCRSSEGGSSLYIHV
jgi:hypothetical protein